MEGETLVRPCTYYEVKSLDGIHRYFWVELSLLIDNDMSCHVFLHSNDQFENMLLARESGIKTFNTSVHVLVSHDFLPDLYRQILEYEDVLKSEGISKPQQKYTFKKQ